jgi:hypothetical protein
MERSMIADTHMTGCPLLLDAGVRLHSVLAAARARLVAVARIALVASIVPVTVFIGWLASNEPSVMIGSALVLALWIGCDHEHADARPSKPVPRMPSLRGPAARRSSADLRATTAWS